MLSGIPPSGFWLCKAMGGKASTTSSQRGRSFFTPVLSRFWVLSQGNSKTLGHIHYTDLRLNDIMAALDLYTLQTGVLLQLVSGRLRGHFQTILPVGVVL